jgi:sugar/nucleoside kinase (ribokinase family)
LNVGKFHFSSDVLLRCGGSTSNIALGVASGPVDTGFVTYLGEDETASRLEPVLRKSKLKHLIIKRGPEETPRCQVIVDSSGERTLILLTKLPKNHGGISFKQAGIGKNDIAVFTHWYEEWRSELKFVQEIGCKTVVGLGTLIAEPEVSADVAIGSIADLPCEIDFMEYLERFPMIVVTAGLLGSKMYSRNGVIHQEALPAETIDATGAGDSFLSGFLTGYALGITKGEVLLELGARWSKAMVEIDASIPPDFYQVPDLSDFLERHL